MGGFGGLEGACTFLSVMLAVLVAVFAMYFTAATRRVKHCKTLPERRSQHQIIALYGFASAPLSFLACLVSSAQLYRYGMTWVLFLGFIPISVFILYGLINLSRARDIEKAERFCGGEDQKRA